MWFMNFRAWKTDLPAEDEAKARAQIALEKSAPEAIGWTDPRQFHELRVHGNPLLETATAQWHESVDEKRAENPLYFQVGSPEAIDHYGRFYKLAEGLYLIDSDDPELLEFGDEGIHERLTSHLGDFLKTREHGYQEAAELVPDIDADHRRRTVDAMYMYFENLFFSNLEAGYLPSNALCVEIFRQSRGLPYDFVGADIE